MSDYPIAGYHGRILSIDLTTGRTEVSILPPALVLDYLGGRGLATRLFYERMDPAADPLGPDNVIVIATSPLIGTNAPTAGRGHMVFKSPLTGMIGTSNSGGSWAAGLKSTGFDALVIRGASREPVLLDIEPGRVEIRSASRLWGKTIPETTDALADAAEGEKPWHILCIGPAGENLVRLADVANDRNRVYGRSGPGAVWGSKKLKAIRVRGKIRPPVADPEKFKSGRDQALYLMKQAPVTKRLLKEFGSAGLVELINLISMLPHRNFQDCQHAEEAVDRISGETLAKTLLQKAGACYLCPIACQRHTRVVNADGREEHGEGPEYETTVLLGPVCDVYDLEAITRTNYRCNEYGLDTISYGGTLACAMELAEAGHIPAADLGGVDLAFGKAEAMESLVRLTALRQGPGDKLAEGSWRLAAGYGHPEYSMSVKKLEIPGYDPRASFPQALGYMTSPTGACHLRGGYAVSLAFFGGTREIPRFSLLQSPIAIRNMQNLGILQDSLGICRFTGFALSTDPWARMVSGVTGQDFSVTRFEEIANRVASLERLFNLRAGATPDDDLLPSRFSEIPVVIDGRERRLGKEDMVKMRTGYYRVRGWDGQGRPERETLRHLRIEE